MWRKYCNGKEFFSFIFFLVFLSVLGYWLVMPMWAKTSSLQRQNDELGVELKNIHTFMSNHADLMDYEAGVKKQLYQADNHLPDTLEMSTVLQSIEQAATGCGANIIALEPQQREDRELYMEIPLRLKVVSQYEQLLSFVKLLESFRFFGRVEVVRIKSEDVSLQSELIVSYFTFKSMEDRRKP